MTNPARDKIKILQAENVHRPFLENLVRHLDFSNDLNRFLKCVENKDEGCVVLVAAAAARPCGVVVINFKSLYPPFRRLGVPEIQDLNVAPGDRRTGVGESLVWAAEEVARAQGAEMIGLGVGLTASYGPAQRLYVRLGYVPDGAGVCYDGQAVPVGALRPMDDDLRLMMVKVL